jgi:hypothetical protein
MSLNILGPDAGYSFGPCPHSEQRGALNTLVRNNMSYKLNCFTDDYKYEIISSYRSIFEKRQKSGT